MKRTVTINKTIRQCDFCEDEVDFDTGGMTCHECSKDLCGKHKHVVTFDHLSAQAFGADLMYLCPTCYIRLDPIRDQAREIVSVARDALERLYDKWKALSSGSQLPESP